MSSNKYQACTYCNETCKESKWGKTLCKGQATSILCSETLLHENNNLKMVAENDCNKYFLVEDTNTVILHVEDSFCILLDYEVDNWQNEKCNLPKMLSTVKYLVYQLATNKIGRTTRDWVRYGSSDYIGYDIHKLVYGEHTVKLRRSQKLTLDHEAETYDERTKNTTFSKNPIEKSHRTRVYIKSEEELDTFISDIVANEGVNDGIYFDKVIKRKKKFRKNVR